MKSRTRVSAQALAALFALSLAACGSVEHRADFQPRSQAGPAIEVIDSNYVESPNDTEVVQTETPWQVNAAAAFVA